MAGIQAGLGAMFQSIGNSMGRWEQQKAQAQQIAMDRALKNRQLELAELENERQEREGAARIEQAEFDRTFQMANVLPEGSVAQPEFAASLRKFGGGGMLTPSRSNVSVPNLRGIPGPAVAVNNPTLPETFTGTQPPALRNALIGAESRETIAAQRHALQEAALREKIAEADRRGDRAAVAQSIAELRALTEQNKANATIANMGVDNQAAWENRALNHAKAIVGDSDYMEPEDRERRIIAAIDAWKKANPMPTGSAGTSKKSGLF